MSPPANPALTALSQAIHPDLVFGQVLIARTSPDTFELRHVADRAAQPAILRALAPDKLRELAQFTGTGAFRPLRSAPTLRAGWRAGALSLAALGAALEHLYPGAVADWFACSAQPAITGYREFTARQSGMYRITQLLDDAAAGAVIAACCHPTLCLKRRLWTVEGTDVDAASEKSVIPCLEPCAVFLEFARSTARALQQPTAPVSFTSEELASLQAALARAMAHPDPSVREADFSAPGNPRRLRLLANKLAAEQGKAGSHSPGAS